MPELQRLSLLRVVLTVLCMYSVVIVVAPFALIVLACAFLAVRLMRRQAATA